jgi:tetratricopeptide (TPR) repeat protein
VPLCAISRGVSWRHRRSGEEKSSEVDIVQVNLLRARLARGPRALIEWGREGNLPKGINLLILVDQFEELFRYDDGVQSEETEAFISLLLESSRPTGNESPWDAEFPIYVALTIRSEYLGACAFFTDLTAAINGGSYLIPPMTREQCREAIVGPAKICGIEIDPVLANRLLNDLESFAPWDNDSGSDTLSRLARRADQLPVMQHALNQLWQEAKEANQRDQGAGPVVLTLEKYEAIGEAAGAIDQHANKILRLLGPERAQLAETVFRALTSGTTVANAVRRPTSFRQLVELCNGDENGVRAVIEAFRAPGCNFLLPEVDDEPKLTDQTMVDIAHESLIRQWKSLSRWLEKEGRAAHEWQRLKEDSERGRLLYWRQLREAVKLRDEVKLTPAWAERNGGGFDKVTRMISRSEWFRRSVAGLVVVIAMLGLQLGWGWYGKTLEASQQVALAMQQKDFANSNFKLVVTSARKVLDTLGESVKRGDITLRGANSMLRVAGTIVEQAHDVEQTKQTIGLAIELGLTASDLYASIGDNTEAYNSARRGSDLAEKLRAANPNDPETLQFLYNSLWRMGDATSSRGGDDPTQKQALTEFLQAEKLAERLVELAPENTTYRHDVVFIKQRIGDVFLGLNDSNAALDEYHKALTLIQDYIGKAPKNRQWLRELANTQSRVGQALSQTSDFAGALEQLRAALKIRIELLEADRDNSVLSSNLAITHRNIAILYANHDMLDAALDEYGTAVAIQELLVARDPDNAFWLSPLANLYTGIGDILTKQAKFDDALGPYRKAYEIRDKLARKDPSNPGPENNFAKAEISLADTLVKLKLNLEEALRLYRGAILILDDARPRSHYDTTIVDAYLQIGSILRLQTNLKDALTEYKRAAAIAQESVDANPGSVPRQRRLAASFGKIGDLLVEQATPGEAGNQYRLALEIATALATKFPKSEEWSILAESLREKMHKLNLSAEAK